MRQIRRRHAEFNVGVTACFCTCWIEVGEDHRSFGAVAGFVAAAGSSLCLRRLLGGRLGAFLQFSDIEKSFRQKTALRYFLQPCRRGWELKKKDGKKTAHVAQIAYPTHPLWTNIPHNLDPSPPDNFEAAAWHQALAGKDKGSVKNNE